MYLVGLQIYCKMIHSPYNTKLLFTVRPTISVDVPLVCKERMNELSQDFFQLSEENQHKTSFMMASIVVETRK